MFKSFCLFTSILIGCLSSGILIYAQKNNSIKEVFAKASVALSEKSTIVYEIKLRDFKSENDSAFKYAICKLTKNHNDYLKCYYNLKMKKKDYFVHFSYDGKYFLYEDTINNEVLYEEVFSDGYGWHYSIDDYIPFFLKGQESGKSPFGTYNSILGKLLIKTAKISDTIINKDSCFMIDIKLKDGKVVRNNRKIYYIRKSDYLPIAYYDSSTVYGVPDPIMYFISYIDFPENIFLNDYSINLDNYPSKQLRKEKFEIKKDIELIKIGDKAHDFTAKLINDSLFNLTNNKGKIIILDFWYLTCLPCLKSIPKLNQLATYLKDENDILILGINKIDNKQEVYNYFEQQGIVYLSTFQSNAIDSLYGIEAHPTICIIDKNGIVRHVEVGYDNKLYDNILKIINELR